MIKLIKSICFGLALLLGLSSVAVSKDWGKVTVLSETKRNVFKVELALSQAEQVRGMMGRQSIAPDRGMLFIYKKADSRSFWMKNTPLDLDIIYIGLDGAIDSIVIAKANDETPLPSKGDDIIAVLEIAGGRSAELGIKVGDKVEHPAFRFARKQAAK